MVTRKRPAVPGQTKTAQVQPNHQSPPGPIANTTGIVVPDTAPNPRGNSAPPIKPTEPEKSWWQRWGSDLVHTGLDVIGLIPGPGELADAANALIYLAEGDKVNAALSAAAAWPAGGQAATAAKWGKKGADTVGAAAQAGKVEQKVATRAAREGAEDGAQAGSKGGSNGKGGKDKGKKKLRCGDSGKYGDLKKRTGDGKFDRDHIPSKAALKERARALAGGKLSKAQESAIDKAGEAIAIPRQAHIDISPTYGQSTASAVQDAKDLAGAAQRDVEAMLNEIDKYDEDGGCRDAYKKASEEILKKGNADFDKMLAEILKEIK